VVLPETLPNGKQIADANRPFTIAATNAFSLLSRFENSFDAAILLLTRVRPNVELIAPKGK